MTIEYEEESVGARVRAWWAVQDAQTKQMLVLACFYLFVAILQVFSAAIERSVRHA